MLISRREFYAGGAALTLLTACQPKPGALTISAQGSPGMNPGPDGSDRPLTLTVIQMRGTGAFDASDFFALQNPQAALGGEFAKAEQITLAPGGSATKTITIESGVTAVGIVAGFRNPGGKSFRAKTPAPAKAEGVIVQVGPSGMTMTPA